jgi:hypothetical protein
VIHRCGDKTCTEDHGKTSRSEYLRNLIDLEVGKKRLQDAYPDEQPDKPMLTQIVPMRERHLHRFHREGEPLSYNQGVPVYRRVCACGEVKVDK